MGTVGFPPPIVGGAGGCGWRKLGVATSVPLSVPECPRSGQQYTNRSCRSSLNCLYESACNNVHVCTKLCLSLYVGVLLCVSSSVISRGNLVQQWVNYVCMAVRIKISRVDCASVQRAPLHGYRLMLVCRVVEST